jgi:pimeloyl-ACP methyl ester carboxylesterase
MPYTTSGGVRLYYEVHGAGPAIVLVHGSGGHHAAWWQQVPYLSRHYTVVLPDLRGFGLSDPVEGGPDALDFSDDLAAVLDHAEIARAALLGQSIGAAPCLRLALASPTRVAGVILAHSLGGLSDPDLKALVAADRAAAEALPVIDRLMSRTFQQANPEMTWLFREQGTFNAAKMQDLRNLSASGPTTADVIAAGVRVYFLAGEKDAVLRPATVRAAHARLPGSLLSIVPDAPHSMYWERPALFNAEVHKALQEFYGP